MCIYLVYVYTHNTQLNLKSSNFSPTCSCRNSENVIKHIVSIGLIRQAAPHWKSSKHLLKIMKSCRWWILLICMHTLSPYTREKKNKN